MEWAEGESTGEVSEADDQEWLRENMVKLKTKQKTKTWKNLKSWQLLFL